jgi:phosphate transport system substrate-binding protein
VKLPSLPIQVVFRSDPSGTTEVFSSYLKAAAGGAWALGTGFALPFPRGAGVKGSEGVASAVKATVGAIGYVAEAQAKAASLPAASLRNEAKRYVGPTTAAVNAALAGATLRPYGTTATLLFTPGSPGAYPLSTVSYLIFRRNQLAPGAEAALRHFASWAISEGQRDAVPLGYVPLPEPLAIPALGAIEQS